MKSHTMKHQTTRTLSLKALPLLIGFALPNTGGATSLNEATNTLCDKIKSCAMLEMAQQELPPGMEQMMTAMFEQSCTSIIAPYAGKATNAGLEKKAVDCINSINKLSCGVVMTASGSQTAACKALENAARQAGIDTNIQAEDLGLK
jgi:hypothetical protein